MKNLVFWAAPCSITELIDQVISGKRTATCVPKSWYGANTNIHYVQVGDLVELRTILGTVGCSIRITKVDEIAIDEVDIRLVQAVNASTYEQFRSEYGGYWDKFTDSRVVVIHFKLSEIPKPENAVVFLDSEWFTERLMIRDAELGDEKELQEIFESSGYLGYWDGNSYRDPGYIRRCLTLGDLPSGGVRELFRFQAIVHKAHRRIMGYLSFYHGYPAMDCLYIANLLISPRFQDRGYGSETIEHFLQLASSKNYQRIRLNVALKNWPALRFWTKLGFDRIIKVHGDRVIGATSFAGIELENILIR